MGRPKGSRNKHPIPTEKTGKFYWGIVSDKYKAELAAFKRMHDRVRDGKCPFIQWNRNLDGFVGFVREAGRIPSGLKKPSIGRLRHDLGYMEGNVAWEEHAENSIKRKGTRYEC